MSIVCPPELRRLYSQGRVLPFVGAGASVSVGWSDGLKDKRGLSWSELVNRAAQMVGFSDPELLRIRANDLQILEYFAIRKNNFASLMRWFATEMSPPEDSLRRSPIHRELAELSKCKLIYTTNFDDFLERALRSLGRRCRAIAIEDDVVFASDVDFEVVKFHGDLDHPDCMVLSESDYEKRLTLQSPMDHKLRADMLGKALLFIGYSFRDSNVSYLFRLAKEQVLPTKSWPRGFITVADPSEFERQLFDRRGIEIIPILGSRETEDVAALLNAMRG